MGTVNKNPTSPLTPSVKEDVFGEVFKRTTPSITADSSILIAGSVLGFHGIDGLGVIRKKAYTDEVVFGCNILTGLVQAFPTNIRGYIMSKCGSISMRLPVINYDATLAGLLSKFIQTKFGLAFVHKAGGALISLSDLLQLYDKGFIDTELTCKDVASSPFRLQNDATLKEALEEMIRRRIRRVFVNDSNSFVSDRTAIDYIFSPEGIRVLRDELYNTRIQDIRTIDATPITGKLPLKDGAKLLLRAKGTCLICEAGVVTPWDCVVKPFQMNGLSTR
jgi:CBS domain-containing protein